MRNAALLLLLISNAIPAQTRAAGVNQAVTAEIPKRMKEAIDAHVVNGAVTLVATTKDVVEFEAQGMADVEANRPMRKDTIFQIMSMTKPFTAAGIMMLADEGKLALRDPVEQYLPEFHNQRVAANTGPDNARLGIPEHPITIRDLLTHTAGISYGTDSALATLYREKGLGPAAGSGWYTADKDEPICATMERLASLPFANQPGEAWVYGYNTDILGCVVEVASGVPLDEFIRTRITQPLGMKDTHFFVPAAKRERLVALYASDAGNHVARAPDGAKGQGHYVNGPRRSFSGGAGLVSTARDYARLMQMMLNGGELDGVRVLSPQTVALMTTNQTGTLYSTSGEGFGLGFSIVERLGADNTLFSVGAFGWGGAYGSQYRVDRKQGVVLIFMLNQLPNRSDVAGKFPVLVYQAMTSVRE